MSNEWVSSPVGTPLVDADGKPLACPVCGRQAAGWIEKTESVPRRPRAGLEWNSPGSTKVYVQPCGCHIWSVERHRDRLPDGSWGPIVTTLVKL